MSAESELVDQIVELAWLPVIVEQIDSESHEMDMRNLLAEYRETVWQNGYDKGHRDARWDYYDQR